MKNYYKILGIERNSTEKQIRKKTYLKGKLLHPKKNKSLNYDPNSFIDAIEAYTVLHDKSTKEIYDWIIDHENGIHKLREEALLKHYKTIEIASINGINSGKSYAKSAFCEFRDDFNSTHWWNWTTLIQNLLP